MKSVSRFASSILVAGIVAGLPAALFAADPPSTQPLESKVVINTQADARVPEAISSIEKAPDPSAVVEAYANATEKDSVPLKQAYVKRLAALGVPELAEMQCWVDLAQAWAPATAWRGPWSLSCGRAGAATTRPPP